MGENWEIVSRKLLTDHCSRGPPPKMLGAPHLMLANLICQESCHETGLQQSYPRSYDSFVFHMCSHVAQLTDNALRLYESI